MNKKKIIKAVALTLICFIAECLISNFTAVTLKLSGAEEVKINLESESVDFFGTRFARLNNEITVQDGELTVNGLNTELKNICFDLSGDSLERMEIDIAYLDENFAYGDGYNYNLSTAVVYTGMKNYYNVSSYGKISSLKIYVDDSEVTFSDIILNSPPKFRFSLVRFITMLGIAISVVFGLWKWTLDDGDYIILKTIMIIMCLTVCATLFMLSNNDEAKLLDNYPSENYSSEDQYRQLFESFKKGQLNLDLDYDVEKLEALDNPYDRSERNAKDTTGIFWDRAYYNGKFYSYFGVAPVITVYYPINILTGKVPTPLLASGILCIYDIIFMSLLYMQLIKRFCREVPLMLAILGELALIFGSAIFAVALEALFYYMAVLSGAAWTAAFLYFLLKAYYESGLPKRISYLVLSGIFAVLIVASRPTLVFYGAVALVPAFFILTSKKESLKRKISYIAAIGMPILTGAVLIMLYNYRRFDNPFEFGFNYQLTVSIAKANTFTFSMIPAAIYHYFFQQPNYKWNFPHIELKSKSLEAYGRYNYNGRTMGVLNYPITWGYFLMPFMLRKRDKFKTAFLLAFGISAAVMAYIDMCKAGAHYRYTLDILMPIILVSLVTIFDCLSALKKLSPRAYATAYIFVVLAMIITIYIGYLLIFADENRDLLDTYTITGKMLQNL